MTQPSSATRLWLGVFLTLSALFMVTATWNEQNLSPDPVAAAMSAWSVAEDGDLELSQAEQRNEWVFDVDGTLLSNRQPGVIAAGVPFYLLSRPFTDGFSLVPMAVAAAVITAAAAATFTLLLLQIGASRRAAAAFAVVGSLASATWSVSADALWTHGPDQLLLVSALLFASRQRYWLAGLSLGAAVTVRTHLAVVALTLGVAALAHTRRLRPFIAIGVGSALGLAAVFLYTSAFFGAWSLNAGYTATGGYPSAALAQSTLATTLENLLGSLLNPNRGLLLTTPVVLVLLPGLVRCWRDAEWWARAAAVGGVVYTIVQCRLNAFSGGTYFWGSRLTLELVTLCGPLLWLSWRATARRSGEAHAALRALTVLTVGMHAAGQFVALPSVGDGWTTWFVRQHAFGLPHSPMVRATMCIAALVAMTVMLEQRRHNGRSARVMSRDTLPQTEAVSMPEQRQDGLFEPLAQSPQRH